MLLGSVGAMKVGRGGLWAMIERKLAGLCIALRPGAQGQRLDQSKWVQGTAGK